MLCMNKPDNLILIGGGNWSGAPMKQDHLADDGGNDYADDDTKQRNLLNLIASNIVIILS